MKVRLLACLVVCLLFAFGCEKESQDTQTSKLESLENFAKGNNKVFQTCHMSGDVYKVKGPLNEKSLKAHLRHGDVQLIDEDGDGYVTAENECDYPVDCDDSDPTKTESCTTLCEVIASQLETFQIDISGGLKVTGGPFIRYDLITTDGTIEATCNVNIIAISPPQYYICGNYYDSNGNLQIAGSCLNPYFQVFADDAEYQECLEYLNSLIPSA